MGKTNWPDEDKAILKQMLEDGKNYAEISDKLGRGKNSVIGAAHRMGLVMKPPTRVQLDKIAVKRRRVKMFMTQIEALPELPKIMPPIEMMEGGVTIMELNDNHCRAIIGYDDDSAATARYCGAAKTVQSYCSYHALLYYQPPKAKPQ